jgi:hypothetical protein
VIPRTATQRRGYNFRSIGIAFTLHNERESVMPFKIEWPRRPPRLGRLFDGIPLPTWVQSLRAVIGKRLLRLEIPKPHWQEGFFNHLLRSHESYAQKWDYVRLYPVRAKLSQTPETWPYQGEIVSIPFD